MRVRIWLSLSLSVAARGRGKGGMEMRAAGGCCALEFTYGVTNLWVLRNDVIYEPCTVS